MSISLGRDSRALDFFALLLFVLFAGLRFETGNDWLIYKQDYELIQVSDFFAYAKASTFEPLYLAATFVSSQIVSFQVFLFLVSVFNGFVLQRFCRFFGAGFSGVGAICFCWTYLATNMATLRFSLSTSMVLLAVLFWLERHRFKSIFISFLSVGFHTFSVVFVPLLLLSEVKLKAGLAFLTLSAGVLFGLSFNYLVGSGLFSYIPFSEKLLLYTENQSPMSIGSLLYVVLNGFFMICLFRDRIESELLNLVRWSTLILLSLQVGMWFLPVFWNRYQVITVAIQAVYVSFKFVKRGFMLETFILMVISLAVLAKNFLDPAFIAYVPYQNVISQTLSATKGDGEQRFNEALDAHIERNIK
ncbi:EpsG family protein [Pseudomonas sp. LB3P31]